MNAFRSLATTTSEPAALAAESGELVWELPNWALLLCVAGGIALLLLLIIKVELHAFVALLIVSVAVGFAAGVAPADIPGLLEDGIGSTLGDIAIIVALGAMLGRMMQESGAARVLSDGLLNAFGERRAPMAVGLTALIFGIPVFFDVGFIILLPLIYAVAARTGRSLISIALPAVGGLAIMHAVLPPHPGPVAAAGLLGASLGWVAIMGLICGLPAWFIGAYLFGTRLGDRMFVPVPQKLFDETSGGGGARGNPDRPDGGTGNGDPAGGESAESSVPSPTALGTSATIPPQAPSMTTTLVIITMPVLLIMLHTFSGLLLSEGVVLETLQFIGNPVTALIITTLLSFWVLGIRGGFSTARIEKAASASLGPIALVLLVTGAGGVFGEVLEHTGAGEALANLLGTTSLPVIVLAFLIATALRVALGSKTVAIVTTAPIVAPLIQQIGLSQPEIALVVIAIASGGTVLSHVNDSGFWLFSRYLDLDIKTTLKSWTLMETFMGGAAFLIAGAISLVLSVT